MIKSIGLVAVVSLSSVILVSCGENKDSDNALINEAEKIESSNTINLEEMDSNKMDSNGTITTESNATNQITQNDITSTNQPQNTDIDAASLYKKCISCHGEKGDKIAPGSVGGVLISSLSKDNIIKDLKGFRARTLSKGGTSAIMYLQTAKLSDNDIEMLGEYVSTLNK